MTDHNLGFDPADTELARQLCAAAPPAGDADAVLTGLRPRLARARRRRQAGFGAVTAAAVVLLAGVGFAATDPGDGSKVRVPPADRSPVSVDSVPAPTTPTEPLTTPDGRTTVPTTSPSSTPTTPGTVAPGSPPTTIDDHGGNRGPGSTSSGSDSSGSGSSGSGSSGSGSSGSGSSGQD